MTNGDEIKRRIPKFTKREYTEAAQRVMDLSGGAGFLKAGTSEFAQYQSEFPEGSLSNERMYKKPAITDITIYEQYGEKGVSGETDYDRYMAQQKAPGITPEQQSIWTKIAGIGLAPAAIIGNLLTGGLELITGEKYGRTDPFKLAETPAGKALGMATMTTAIALGTALMASLLTGAAAVKGGVITQTAYAGGKVVSAGKGAYGIAGARSITYQKALSAFGSPAASKVSLLFQAAKNLGPTATKSLLTANAMKKIGYGAAALSGTSGIMTWLASDNIMQGISIHVRDLPWAVKSGLPKEDALSAVAEMQEWKNYAEGFVKVNSKLNPVLWPFGKILLMNAQKVQRDLDLATRNITWAGMEGMPIR